MVDAWLTQQGGARTVEPAGATSPGDDETQVIQRRGRAGDAAAKGAKADSVGALGGAGAVVWPLTIVLGTIGGLAYFMRRWMGGPKGLGGDGSIKVLARHFLSNKQSLCLVRVGRRIVLLGVTPDRIASLADITDPEEVAHFATAARRGAAGSFSAALATFTQRERADADEAENEFASPMSSAESSGGMSGNLAGRTVREALARLRALAGGSRPMESV